MTFYWGEGNRSPGETKRPGYKTLPDYKTLRSSGPYEFRKNPLDEEVYKLGEPEQFGPNCTLCSKPLGLTDEMVQRAAVAFYRPESEEDWVAPPVLIRNMRSALEAALGVDSTAGQAPSEAKEPSTGEQADPGSVPSPEGVRSAALAESFWSAINKLGREVGGPLG